MIFLIHYYHDKKYIRYLHTLIRLIKTVLIIQPTSHGNVVIYAEFLLNTDTANIDIPIFNLIGFEFAKQMANVDLTYCVAIAHRFYVSSFDGFK